MEINFPKPDLFTLQKEMLVMIKYLANMCVKVKVDLFFDMGSSI